MLWGLVFGKLTREPFSETLSQNEKLQTYDDYFINFVRHLHEMRTQARGNLVTAKSLNRKTDSSSRQSNKKIAHKYTKLIN